MIVQHFLLLIVPLAITYVLESCGDETAHQSSQVEIQSLQDSTTTARKTWATAWLQNKRGFLEYIRGIVIYPNDVGDTHYTTTEEFKVQTVELVPLNNSMSTIKFKGTYTSVSALIKCDSINSKQENIRGRIDITLTGFYGNITEYEKRKVQGACKNWTDVDNYHDPLLNVLKPFDSLILQKMGRGCTEKVSRPTKIHKWDDPNSSHLIVQYPIDANANNTVIVTYTISVPTNSFTTTMDPAGVIVE